MRKKVGMLDEMQPSKSQGSALLVVLGILAVVVLMAATFAMLMRLELTAANNFSHNAQARLIAQAGLEYAVAELAVELRPDAAVTAALWEFGSVSKTVDLQDDAFQGSFTISVVDFASRIYLNSTSQDFIETQLLNLRDSLGLAQPSDTDIHDVAVGGPYLSTAHPKQVVFDASPTKQADWDALAPYLVVHAWEDPSALASDGSLQPRAPVNINTADQEVSTALLWDLSDGTWNLSDGSGDLDDDKYDTIATALGAYLAANTYDTWPDLHNAVVGFEVSEPSINEGELALSLSLVHAGIFPHHPTDASFQPHTVREGAGVGPDNLLVGKSDLVRTPSEVCLFPPGIFEITSIGRVKDIHTGQILAEDKIITVVRRYENKVWTSQEDFVTGGDFVSVPGLAAFPTQGTPDNTIGRISLALQQYDLSAYTFGLPMNGNWDPNPGTASQIGTVIAEDLIQEGVRVGHNNRTLVYDAIFPAPLLEKGTLGFWFRPDWDGDDDLEHVLFTSDLDLDGTEKQLRIVKRDSAYATPNALTWSMFGRLKTDTPPGETYYRYTALIDETDKIERGRWYYVLASWDRMTRHVATPGDDPGVEMDFYLFALRDTTSFDFNNPLDPPTVIAVNLSSDPAQVQVPSSAQSVVDDLFWDATYWNMDLVAVLDFFQNKVARFRDPGASGAQYISAPFASGYSGQARFSAMGYLPSAPSAANWGMLIETSSDGGGTWSLPKSFDQDSGLNLVDGNNFKYRLTVKQSAALLPEPLGHAPVLERAVLTYLAPVRYLEWVVP